MIQVKSVEGNIAEQLYNKVSPLQNTSNVFEELVPSRLRYTKKNETQSMIYPCMKISIRYLFPCNFQLRDHPQNTVEYKYFYTLPKQVLCLVSGTNNCSMFDFLHPLACLKYKIPYLESDIWIHRL